VKIVTEEDTRQESQILRLGYPVYTQYGNNENPFGDRTTVENVISLIEKNKDNEEPIFLFTGVSGPHDPYCVPQEFENLYNMDEIELPESFDDDMNDKPNLYKRVKEVYANLTREEHKKSILKYLAFCSFEDYLFKKVFEASKNLKGRNIIIYLSDHGDYLADHGLWAKGLPCFDGAYHIPLMIYDSENEKSVLVDKYVSLTDLAPTIIAYCSISISINFSGKSLLPYITCNFTKDIRDCVFTQSNGNELYGIQRSVRNNKYKLVYNGFDFDEFYDLEKDSYEKNNVINNEEYTEAIREMYFKLWSFAYEHKDTCINPYIMVGLSKFGPGIIFNNKVK